MDNDAQEKHQQHVLNKLIPKQQSNNHILSHKSCEIVNSKLEYLLMLQLLLTLHRQTVNIITYLSWVYLF